MVLLVAIARINWPARWDRNQKLVKIFSRLLLMILLFSYSHVDFFIISFRSSVNTIDQEVDNIYMQARSLSGEYDIGFSLLNYKKWRCFFVPIDLSTEFYITSTCILSHTRNVAHRRYNSHWGRAACAHSVETSFLHALGGGNTSCKILLTSIIFHISYFVHFFPQFRYRKISIKHCFG